MSLSLDSHQTRPDRADASAPLVLHVTEALGGGLEDAIHDFVRSAPQYRHALLFTRRGDFATAEAVPELIEAVDAGRGFRALHAAYGPAVDRLRPDVVHLHSAWAGLIGRLPAASSHTAPIVYSPHSYFFDRRDVARPIRGVARALERVLAARTAVTAAVSPFEAETARRLGSVAAYVPNVARLPERLRWTGRTDGPEILVVGRIAAQKDPEFLLRVVERVAADVPGIRWTWVGDGDGDAADRLRGAGVRVTGWVPRDECLAMMARASVYLHTAAWEGSPITLLEAARIGVPIVARSIPALDSLGFDPHLRTPAEVAAALRGLLLDGRRPVSPAASSPGDQAAGIGRAYAQAIGGAGVPVAVAVRLAI